MKRLAVIGILALGLMMIGGLGAQAAKTKKVKTTVTLKVGEASGYSEGVFKGKVKSKNKKCKAKRKIVIKRDGQQVAKTKTNKKGVYKVSAAATPAGTYQAIAKKKTEKSKGKKLICKTGKSKKIKVA